MSEYDKYFETYSGTPRNRKSSVLSSDYRLTKAKEQAELKPVAVDKVIKYINDFLAAIDMDEIESPVVKPTEISYMVIRETNHLKDKGDIVWLKFTKDGYVGVVAASNDVNFNIPETDSAYNDKESVLNERTGKYDWKYNTAGIIVHSVNKEWDENFVLLFPLREITYGRKRGDIEKAIGNYLIDKGVPILDFYSHNY